MTEHQISMAAFITVAFVLVLALFSYLIYIVYQRAWKAYNLAMVSRDLVDDAKAKVINELDSHISTHLQQVLIFPAPKDAKARFYGADHSDFMQPAQFLVLLQRFLQYGELVFRPGDKVMLPGWDGVWSLGHLGVDTESARKRVVITNGVNTREVEGIVWCAETVLASGFIGRTGAIGKICYLVGEENH